MASDAVSSAAYTIEEILIVLVPAFGLIGLHFIPYITISILLLLITLVLYYSQIINHYPMAAVLMQLQKKILGRWLHY
jgi:hypothetical protein